MLQIPGLIVEPLIFTIICYFLAGLRPTAYAFVMTAIITIIVMNVATACGMEIDLYILPHSSSNDCLGYKCEISNSFQDVFFRLRLTR